MEANILGVIEDTKKMRLDGVRITGLTKNLQQGGVRNEKETREQQPES